MTGQDNYRALNQRISLHLAKQSIKAPTFHIASFPKKWQRWPADQTVTLYSLYLYDKNFNTRVSQAPIQNWLRFMDTTGKNLRFGLPMSEVKQTHRRSVWPRGSALSWSVRYMAAFAPDAATVLWRTYRDQFQIRVEPIFRIPRMAQRSTLCRRYSFRPDRARGWRCSHCSCDRSKPSRQRHGYVRGHSPKPQTSVRSLKGCRALNGIATRS